MNARSATVSCHCDECNQSFFVKADEVRVLPGMRPTPGRQDGDPLLNWADWVAHIETHCPECRIPVPPPDCVKDLERQVERYKRRYGLPEDEEI